MFRGIAFTKNLERCLCTMLSAVIVLSCGSYAKAASEFPFTDVSEDCWYRDYVETAWESGLIAGTSDSAFSPDAQISIASVIALASRMHQLYFNGSVTLQNGSELWYSTYENYAVANNIIQSGVYDNDMDRSATRTEFVKIFYSALPSSEYTAKNTVADGAIPDVDMDNDAAYEIYTFYRAGILTGSDSSSIFQPDFVISRSEVAAIMARMFTPELRQEITLTSASSEVSANIDTSAMPKIGDAATVQNVTALLNAYDPDGAYIINDALSRNENILVWFTFSDALSNIETAVHEECHSFTFYNGSFGSEAIYTGNGSCINVNYTSVYESQEMISMIPDECRTFRFSTYVNTTDSLDSRVKGAYGLLNEFSAYCWGMNTSVSLFDYYKTLPQTPDTWFSYVSGIGSNAAAYAEFRYYILTYLIYAQENYPEVYYGIMSNINFLAALRSTDIKFRSLISQFYDTLDELNTIMSAEGYSVKTEDGILWIGNSGTGVTDDGYTILMDHMESNSAYQNMYALLMA